MKKQIAILVFSLTIISLISTSCKKDFKCECNYKNVLGAPDTYSFVIEDAKKKDAKEACESYTFTGWTEVDCQLK